MLTLTPRNAGFLLRSGLMDMQEPSSSPPESGIERFEDTPDVMNSKVIFVCLFIGIILMCIFTVLPQVQNGTSINKVLLMFFLPIGIVGLIFGLTLVELAKPSVELDWERQIITFRNCYRDNWFLAARAMRHAEKPMRSLVRADETTYKGNRSLVVKFLRGEAHLQAHLSDYESLRDRLDQIALRNNHSGLDVTMSQLKWRRFGLTLVIGLPLLIGLIAVCVWFVSS